MWTNKTDGLHLEHFSYPVKNSAGYNHLIDPEASCISAGELADMIGVSMFDNTPELKRGKLSIAAPYHQDALQLLSAELGFTLFSMSQMECISCESKSGRFLNLKSVIIKGADLRFFH